MQPPRLRPALALALLLPATPAHAALDALMQAILESDFRLTTQESDIPFPRTAWVQTEYSPHTEISGGARYAETAVSQGALWPASVSKRDMFVLGENIRWDQVEARTGPPDRHTVLTVSPIAAWLRQIDHDNLVAVFTAPFFSRELQHHDSWGMQCFTGVVALHWRDQHWKWLYGGVHEYTFGDNILYPYLGAIWTPSRHWSVNLVIPWPAVSYAPDKNTLYTLGLSPGGSAFVTDSSETKTRYSLNTWNLTTSAGRQLRPHLWLAAGAGISGLRSLTATDANDTRQLKIKSSPFFTLSLQFRP